MTGKTVLMLETRQKSLPNCPIMSQNDHFRGIVVLSFFPIYCLPQYKPPDCFFALSPAIFCLFSSAFFLLPFFFCLFSSAGYTLRGFWWILFSLCRFPAVALLRISITFSPLAFPNSHGSKLKVKSFSLVPYQNKNHLFGSLLKTHYQFFGYTNLWNPH